MSGSQLASPELVKRLEEKAADIRATIVRIINLSGGGHLGGSLSAAEVGACLFFHTMNISPDKPDNPDRDRFVLSAGHKSAWLYSCLFHKGYLDKQTMDSFLMKGSKLGGHPDRKKVHGAEASTGSLGHGLPIGLGMAIAGKKDGAPYRVFVLLGDGELDEGTNWEAAMAASRFGLDNLVAIVDRNRLQLDGFTEDVMGLEPLVDKWRAFGWSVREIDGHDMGQVVKALSDLPEEKGKPTVILSGTVKGKGISFLENQASCHYRSLTAEEFSKAVEELGTCKEDQE